MPIPFISRIAGLVVAVALVSPLDAAPRLVTITMDGDLADWSQVEINTSQTSFDAAGALFPDCALSRDRDCDVQDVGRDLREFSWTHDTAHLFVRVVRDGAGGNTDAFWTYLDLDGDDRMGASDVVLRVKQRANTQDVDSDLFPYLPIDPLGDPMTDPVFGLADGWVPPGAIDSSAIWSETITGSTADGTAFEARVPWSALGVAPGTGINFHVAASNNSNPQTMPSSAEDNLGSADSGTGSGFVAALLEADSRTSVTPGGVATHVITLTNVGLNRGSFRLSLAGSLALRETISVDADLDGTPDAVIAEDANANGRFTDNGDSITAGWDRDGDGYPEIANVDPGQSIGLFIDVRARSGGNRTDVTTFRASPTPQGDSDEVTLETGVGNIHLGWNQSLHAVAGQSAAFPLEACNEGAAGVVDINLRSESGHAVRLATDPTCDGVPDQILASDVNGDGVWDSVTGGDSDADGLPDTGMLATGDCTCLAGIVDIPANEPNGNAGSVFGIATGIGYSQMKVEVTVHRGASLEPSYLVADGTELHGGPGKSVFFAHVLRNALGGNRAFEVEPLVNAAGWPAFAWTDPNGDGNISDGEPLTVTPALRHNSGRFPLVVQVVVPQGAALGSMASTPVVLHDVNDETITARATDEVVLSQIATYADTLHRQSRMHFAACDTVRVQASGLDPSRRAGYVLRYVDPSGADRRVVDPLVSDSSGFATDELALGAIDATGTWRLILEDAGGLVAERTFVLEAAGRLAGVSARPAIRTTEASDLFLEATVFNTGATTDLASTQVGMTLVSPSATTYLAGDGSVQPYTGVEVTLVVGGINVPAGERLTIGRALQDVVLAELGTWRLDATLQSTCGSVIATGVGSVVVQATVEDCSNGVDDDSDTLVDCDDPECFLSPNCANTDGDGDGIDNGADCSPLDGGSFAVPIEPLIMVVKSGSVALMAWTNLAVQAGASTTYDVATGGIVQLWTDRSFVSATCLATPAAPAASDSRRSVSSDGWWYLVKGENACGDSPWGNDSFGVQRNMPDACP